MCVCVCVKECVCVYVCERVCVCVCARTRARSCVKYTVYTVLWRTDHLLCLTHPCHCSSLFPLLLQSAEGQRKQQPQLLSPVQPQDVAARGQRHPHPQPLRHSTQLPRGGQHHALEIAAAHHQEQLPGLSALPPAKDARYTLWLPLRCLRPRARVRLWAGGVDRWCLFRGWGKKSPLRGPLPLPPLSLSVPPPPPPFPRHESLHGFLTYRCLVFASMSFQSLMPPPPSSCSCWNAG